MLSMLNATVSHEMMTPIGCIINYGEISLQEARDKNLKTRIYSMILIAKRLQLYIRDLLD